MAALHTVVRMGGILFFLFFFPDWKIKKETKRNVLNERKTLVQCRSVTKRLRDGERTSAVRVQTLHRRTATLGVVRQAGRSRVRGGNIIAPCESFDRYKRWVIRPGWTRPVCILLSLNSSPDSALPSFTCGILMEIQKLDNCNLQE